MSSDPNTPVWLDRHRILGWQGSLFASETDHGEVLDWLELLQGIINFCEVTAAEDTPRAAHLAGNRAFGVAGAIDEAESVYLQARHEQRERLKESAKRVYDTVRQTLEPLLSLESNDLP